MANKMENHDARIEDNHRGIYELMGTIGYMKEDLHKLVQPLSNLSCKGSSNGGDFGSSTS